MARFSNKTFRKFSIRTQITQSGKLGLISSRKLVDKGKAKMNGSAPPAKATIKTKMADKVTSGQRKANGSATTV